MQWKYFLLVFSLNWWTYWCGCRISWDQRQCLLSDRYWWEFHIFLIKWYHISESKFHQFSENVHLLVVDIFCLCVPQVVIICFQLVWWWIIKFIHELFYQFLIFSSLASVPFYFLSVEFLSLMGDFITRIWYSSLVSIFIYSLGVLKLECWITGLQKHNYCYKKLVLSGAVKYS